MKCWNPQAEFVKAPHGETKPTPAKSLKNDPPKVAQSGKKASGVIDNPSSKTHSRWIEKLELEKRNKTKKQSSLQQKLVDKMGSQKKIKGSLMLPATSVKTISTSKKNKTSTSTTAKISKAPTRVDPNGPAELTGDSALAEVEEFEVNHSCSSVKLLEDKEGNHYGEAQLSVRCYLEASVFTGDVERAQRYLMFHHRHLSKRQMLSVSTYNIMMRAWAKKVPTGILNPFIFPSIRHLMLPALYYIQGHGGTHTV